MGYANIKVPSMAKRKVEEIKTQHILPLAHWQASVQEYQCSQNHFLLIQLLPARRCNLSTNSW